ncbi:NusA-like transcription termination signal-binding factor [Candidatus Woesearchaeota archaeon]|nr:NusA-like transcription termination signal-binding factor [Candidatus Woesearchaeota archaeon]
MKITYNADTIKCISLFQSRTQAAVKDCYIDDLGSVLTFVVQPGDIGKAIGKQGSMVRQLEQAMKRKIKIVEFHPTCTEFVKNMIMPFQAASIQDEEGTIIITPADLKTRGILIGRNASALRNLEKNVKRSFPDIKEIKVV